MDFSILIPVCNSESCLKKTADAVVMAIEKLNKSYELILIDDGSRDKSWEIIKQLRESNKNITGIKLNRNYGQHNALLCGLNNCKGDYIITMDDDLEHNPEDISKIFDELKAGDYDLVYGTPANRRKGLLRHFLTYLFKKASQVENKTAGHGSSFRIFKSSLKEKLIQHHGALFFLDEIVLWYTDQVGYVKLNYLKSQKSASRYNNSTLFTLSWQLLSLSSTMPLRLVRMVGIYMFFLSILLGLVFIVRKMLIHVPMGYTSIMVTILFGTGVITASLGVIGEYIGNLIAISNNKPSYSIKEKI
ncbi:MAG: glycosyltransferase family 2 protein [Bacteroidia bacterium]